MTQPAKFFAFSLLLLALVGGLVATFWTLRDEPGPSERALSNPAAELPANGTATGELTDPAYADGNEARVEPPEVTGAKPLPRMGVEAEWNEEELIWVRGSVTPRVGDGGCSGSNRNVTVYAMLEENEQLVLRELLFSESGTDREGAPNPKARSIFARRELDESGGFRIPFPPDLEIGHLIALGDYESMSNSSSIRLRVERSIILSTTCAGTIQGRVGSDVLDRNELDFGTDEDFVSLTVNPLSPPGPMARAKYSGQHVRIEEDGSFLLRAVPTGVDLQIDVHSSSLAMRRVDLAPIGAGEWREIEVALSPGGTLTGTVVDDEGGPIAGATVEARLPGGAFGLDALDTRKTETNEDGTFVLTAVAPGKVVVVAEKDGWLERPTPETPQGSNEALEPEPASSSSPAEADEETDREVQPSEFDLAAGETVDGIELVLDRGAEIAGVVTFSDGKPAANAQVRVTLAMSTLSRMSAIRAARGGSGHAISGADGNFRVQGLGRGPFTVTASVPDPNALETEIQSGAAATDPLAHARANGEIDDFGPSELAERERLHWKARIDHVEPQTTDVALVLSAPSIVRGRVLLEGSSEPVPEFLVHAQRIDEGILGALGQPHLRSPFRTNDGIFEVTGMGNGTWKITVDAAAYALSETKIVTIPRAEDAEDLQFTLVLGATVSGFVRTPLGLSCPEAEVRTESGRNATMNSIEASPRELVARTRVDGSFRLEGLKPGSIVLEADALGFAASLPAEFELAPGEHRRGVELVLQTGGTIEGQVFDDEGQPAANRMISLNHNKFLDSSAHRSDEEGRFRVESLEPGTWQVTAIIKDIDLAAAARRGDAESENAAQGEILAALRMASVVVENGQTSEVVLGSPPGRRVSLTGRVAQNAEPFHPATITFVPEGDGLLEGMKSAVVNKSGEYETRLPRSGRYSVNIEQSQGTAGHQNSLEFYVEIPDQIEFVHDFEIPSGSISGRITRHDGSPAAQTRVTLHVEGPMSSTSFLGGHFYESQAGPEGRYEVTGLRPGRYRIAVGGMPLGGFLNDSATHGRVVRTGILVEADQAQENIDFELPEAPPGSVEVRVLDAGGSPVRDAAIFARREDGALVETLSWALTGQDGHVLYSGLAAGRYRISARSEHAASDLGGTLVEVPSGETVSVELQAAPATKLLVSTMNEDGEKTRAWYVVENEEGIQVQRMQSLDDIRRAVANGGISLLEASFGPLPPGRYRVTATGPEGKSVTKPVKLSGQGERRLTLRLR